MSSRAHTNQHMSAHHSNKSGLESGRPLAKDPTEYSEVMRLHKPTKSPWAAFMVRPPFLRFDTQDTEEKILVLLRRHPITNVGWILTTLALIFVPFFLVFFNVNLLPGNFVFVTVLFWYVFLFGFAFEKFLVWYFNVFLITDERVIDYDFYSLLYKRVSAAKIDNIEDVTFEMGGVASSLINYGNVFIQTAAETREIEFHNVPKPELVVKLLNELILEEEQEKLEGRAR